MCNLINRCRNIRLICGDVLIGVQGELVIQNSRITFAGQVEIGMVGKIQDSGLVRGRFVLHL